MKKSTFTILKTLLFFGLSAQEITQKISYSSKLLRDGQPDYFETLNMKFRYQLTCIGGFTLVYIAEKITNKSFKIAGETNGMEVSWQVTGIKHDPSADQNRIQVEVEKPDKEKGNYLHYVEYRQPIKKSIKLVKNSDLIKKDKKEEN